METAAAYRGKTSCCSPGQAGLKKHLGRVMKSSLALWKSFGCSKQNPFKLTYTKEKRLLQGYGGISWNSRAGSGIWYQSQGSEIRQQPRQSVLVSLCLSVCLSMLCVVCYLHFFLKICFILFLSTDWLLLLDTWQKMAILASYLSFWSKNQQKQVSISNSCF